MNVRRQLLQLFPDDDRLLWLDSFLGIPLAFEVSLIHFGKVLSEVLSPLGGLQEDFRFPCPSLLLSDVVLVLGVRAEDESFLGLDELLWKHIPYYTGQTTR